MTTDELRKLALAATPRTGRLNCIREDCFCPECALQIAVPAERVLAMIAVIEAAKAMRDAGVSIGQRVVLPDAEPDSMADDTALGEFIGIFDGPLQRDFDAAIDAAKEQK